MGKLFRVLALRLIFLATA